MAYPTKGLSGWSVRVLDLEQRRWAIYWVERQMRADRFPERPVARRISALEQRGARPDVAAVDDPGPQRRREQVERGNAWPEGARRGSQSRGDHTSDLAGF